MEIGLIPPDFLFKAIARPPKKIGAISTGQRPDKTKLTNAVIIISCQQFFSFLYVGWRFYTRNYFRKRSPTRVLAEKMFVSCYLLSDKGFDAGFNLRTSTVRFQRAASLFLDGSLGPYAFIASYGGAFVAQLNLRILISMHLRGRGLL